MSGCRLNEHDISNNIFADLYPTSAFLTIHGDNDDTPCVCSSPFQRFTSQVPGSLGTIWWQDNTIEPIVWIKGLAHDGCVRYDGLSALPSTEVSTVEWHVMAVIGAGWGPLQVLAALMTTDNVSWMQWSIWFDLLGGQTTLVPGNLSGHGSCSICIHVKPLPIWSNLFADHGLGACWF